jgi:hypothetical protein
MIIGFFAGERSSKQGSQRPGINTEGCHCVPLRNHVRPATSLGTTALYQSQTMLALLSHLCEKGETVLLVNVSCSTNAVDTTLTKLDSARKYTLT